MDSVVWRGSALRQQRCALASRGHSIHRQRSELPCGATHKQQYGISQAVPTSPAPVHVEIREEKGACAPLCVMAPEHVHVTSTPPGFTRRAASSFSRLQKRRRHRNNLARSVAFPPDERRGAHAERAQIAVDYVYDRFLRKRAGSVPWRAAESPSTAPTSAGQGSQCHTRSANAAPTNRASARRARTGVARRHTALHGGIYGRLQ